MPPVKDPRPAPKPAAKAKAVKGKVTAPIQPPKQRQIGSSPPASKTKKEAATPSGSQTSSQGSSTDPFAGTPYAGMSAYEIAQKIVNDELQAQRQAIISAMQAQGNINQGQLSTLSGFNQALQQEVSGIGPAFDQTLQQLGNSYQGFTKGYQDTYNKFMSEDGSVSGGGGAQYANPGAGGAQMLAGAAQSGADVTNSLRASNPFNILPAAYGRLGQMDLNMLAAKQSSDMSSTYGSQLASLGASSEGDIFNLFNQIQGMIDSQNQATAAQAASAEAEGTKYAQWLSGQTGQLYLYDPTTGVVKAAHDPVTGKPVYLPGSAGYKNQQRNAIANAKLQETRQNNIRNYLVKEQSIRERIAHDRAIESNASASLQQRQQAAADRKSYESQLIQIQQKRLQLQGQKQTQNQANLVTKQTQKVNDQITALHLKASTLAASLAKQTVATVTSYTTKGSATKGGRTSSTTKIGAPKFTPSQIYNIVFRRFQGLLYKQFQQLHPHLSKSQLNQLVAKEIIAAVGHGP